MGNYDYDDEQDRRENKISLPGNGSGLGLAAVLLPEIIKLHQGGRNVLMTAVALGAFVTGSVLHMVFIDRPIRKKALYEKQADYRSALAALGVLAVGCAALYLRYKFGLN